MAGYPHNPPNYGYGPPPSQPYSAAPGQQPYTAAPGQQPYDATPYGGAPSAPYGAQSEKPHKENPYGAAPPSSAVPYAAPYGGGAPTAPYGGQSEKPHKEKPYGAAPPSSAAPYAAPYGGGAPSAPYGAQSEKPHKEKPYGAAPPASAAPYAAGGYPPQAAPAPYGIPFASLVPSAFPPGTDPSVVSCFQMADQDGSGLIDDKELQRALSSYNQSFSLRTVHLLMYLFTNTNIRKIGPKEFTAVFYSLQSWRGIFERFDRDRSSKIDTGELREALMSLGFAVSPTVLELLVSKFDKTGGKSRAIEYDNFIECCLTVKRFSIKDLGLLSYFLGVEVVPNKHGLLLSQRRYIMDLLTQTKMQDAKAVLTPMPTSPTLKLTSGSSLSDPTEYRKVVGSLQYLLITRPDIAFAVNKLSQYMHCPTIDHWSFVKRLLRYLVGTINDGLQLYNESTLSLHAFSESSLSLQAFSDADWAGDKDTFCSTSAYVVYLGKNLVSWSSKKQQTVARSSTEAEYRSVANTAAELNFICYLLTDLGISLPCCPVIYCDNIGATQLCSNPIFHSRMKHVAIDFHFIRDQVQNGALRVAHVSSEDQLADALTKPLPRQRFLQLKHKIGLLSRAPS